MKKTILISLIIMFILGVISSYLVLSISNYERELDKSKYELNHSFNYIKNSINNNNQKVFFDEINNSNKIGYYLLDNNNQLIYGSDRIENNLIINNLIENGFFLENKEIYFDTENDLRFISESYKLEDGNKILAIKIQENLLFNFFDFIKIILIFSILGIIISMIITEKSVNDFVENIEENIRFSSYENKNIDTKYKEIYPFVKIIHDQRNDINENLKKLKYQSDAIKTILSEMNEGIILLDGNYNIMLINDAAMELSGVESKNINYNGINIEHIFRNSKIKNIQLENINQNENLELHINNKIVEVYLNPVDHENKNVGYVMLLVDKTDKIEVETRRREFSANVSHELKTPLTSINGYAEMIMTGMVKQEDTKKFGAIIYEEGNHLLKMIDDIIKISKLDEKSLDIEEELINLSKIVDEIFSILENKRKDKNILLINEINPLIEIKSNRRLIYELLLNIIDNSIKYNNTNGKVTVNGLVESENIILKIKDTGIGISKDNTDRIFERFFTVDKSHNKKDSSGLGLSIVKHIVNLLEGKIQVNSELNIGTEFIITIPNKIKKV